MDLIQRFLAWLFGKPALRTPDLPPEVPGKREPAWLALARDELGTKEAPGAANNPTVLRYYADAGHPEINADSVAWCAAAVGSWLERSGYPCSKQLNARSYLTWGKAVNKPYPGCIAVFSRGDVRSWEGHVGFYIGEDEKGIQVLGGNQGDAVSVAYQPRSRLLGYREPVRASNSRTVKAATGGIVAAGLGSTTILQSQSDLFGIANTLKELGVSMPIVSIGAQVFTILLFCVVIYARYNDLSDRGR
jgi:uncharacterized protein (TIGR02594 family)